MTIFGHRDQWAIELEPLAGGPRDADPAAEATWCGIKIWAGGKNLAAHTRISAAEVAERIAWPAVYIARWLVAAWPGLWERAGWPLPGTLRDAEIACLRLDQHLAEADDEATDELLDLRDEFVTSHSLLAAAGGGLMPSVYFMREGDHVLVSWNSTAPSDAGVVFHEPRGRAAVNAEVFLESTQRFLAWCRPLVAPHDAALAEAIGRWEARLDQPEAAEAVLRGYLRPWGAPSHAPLAPAIEEALDLPAGWQAAGARLEPSEFSAAIVFRSVSPVLGDDDVLELLRKLRSYPSDGAASRKLDELRQGLTTSLGEPAFKQGYQLATQLRERLGNEDRHLDVEGLLTDLGVRVDTVELADSQIDGAAVWGAAHGPVIVVNTLGKRTTARARRMVLAHELCHLLVDRRAASDLMVASTPWTPAWIERRANAFAAELLLPKAGIRRIGGPSLSPEWASDEDVDALMEEFEVGSTVCRRQIENRF